MGLFCCSARRVYLLFLTITVLQILTTGVRQVFDFLGPLWSMILSNFLNIVFSIFGFFGGYTRRKHYLISYTIWSILWSAWNLFIVLLYIPLPVLEPWKSPILSLNTGGFSWWETRAPGCIPDWRSETEFEATNCLFPPRLMEFIMAGVQVQLSLLGLICSLSMTFCSALFREEDEKDHYESTYKGLGVGVNPSLLSLSRQNVTHHNRASNRIYNRAPLGLPPGANQGDSSDPQAVGGDDRLRPMTPRRVKRRSARSIQSQKFGSKSKNKGVNREIRQADQGAEERPSTSRGSGGSGSARSSLRSNSSRRSHHRSSKRKNHQFVSPVNRLMQQQQVDSETSHDEPRRYLLLRDQGHANPVYQGPESIPKYGTRAPPRPPSARSSYSNYHPARLPVQSQNPGGDILHPNVINLNQNIFTNGGFDMSTEYNLSQHSNNASTALYEDEVNFHPNLSPNPNNPPPPIPNGISLSFKPQNTTYQQQQQQQSSSSSKQFPGQNPTFAYPLAHSPVSQDSFPMWGVSQPQSPISNHFPSPPYQNQTRRPPAAFNFPMTNLNTTKQKLPLGSGGSSQGHPSRQPINSETVI